MRRGTALFLTLATVGCEPADNPSANEAEVASRVVHEEGLYTDADVRKLVALHGGPDIHDMVRLGPGLDVVPNGQSYPRTLVFEQLAAIPIACSVLHDCDKRPGERRS